MTSQNDSLVILKQFSPEDFKTVLLALCYEKFRREAGHYGYRVFGKLTPAIAQSETKSPDATAFRCCATVRRWMEWIGWSVSCRDAVWQDYIGYVFRMKHPKIPYPAQLKNAALAQDYLRQLLLKYRYEGSIPATERSEK